MARGSERIEVSWTSSASIFEEEAMAIFRVEDKLRKYNIYLYFHSKMFEKDQTGYENCWTNWESGAMVLDLSLLLGSKFSKKDLSFFRELKEESAKVAATPDLGSEIKGKESDCLCKSTTLNGLDSIQLDMFTIYSKTFWNIKNKAKGKM
ncbi:RING/U-box superfamily protein [Striga asiatica]|uniref:RING/U-box superfamily protein n=1 Tax=Striga asiatica TaxID=4170 RepID=A0A5A7R6I4_STRAF|nr:RING/U-box superfamily protein [Striga asiatica]